MSESEPVSSQDPERRRGLPAVVDAPASAAVLKAARRELPALTSMRSSVAFGPGRSIAESPHSAAAAIAASSSDKAISQRSHERGLRRAMAQV
jgi:hypothetical protein